MSMATLHGPRRFAHPAFVLVAVAFAAGVTIQIFIAGLAIFVDPVNWAGHASFVNILRLLPLLMLLLAFGGRFPWRTLWQSAALLGLIYVQYITAHMSAVLPWAGAAHPVMAMVLFWTSVRIAANGWRLAFEPDLISDPRQQTRTIFVHNAIAETES